MPTVGYRHPLPIPLVAIHGPKGFGYGPLPVRIGRSTARRPVALGFGPLPFIFGTPVIIYDEKSLRQQKYDARIRREEDDILAFIMSVVQSGMLE